jgi:hypothetical protein
VNSEASIRKTSDNTLTSISQNAIKSGFFVISGRNGGEIAGYFDYYLKKQSQFAPARMGANSFGKEGYENKPGCGLDKNKANSKPISRWRIGCRVDSRFRACCQTRAMRYTIQGNNCDDQ